MRRRRQTAVLLVERYLEDQERVADLEMGRAGRGRLADAVERALRGPTTRASLRDRGRDIWRAWELLRDSDYWQRQPEDQRQRCQRLGWLVARPERIVDQLERAGQAPMWEPENINEIEHMDEGA